MGCQKLILNHQKYVPNLTVVWSKTDYDFMPPFGIACPATAGLMPGRQSSSESNRYEFQGQERDDEIKGNGNSLNYKYRMHDPRLGRFFAVDPLTSKYPHYTPYSFSGNKLIAWRELEGKEETVTIYLQQTVANDEGTSGQDQELQWFGSSHPVTPGSYGYGNEGILELWYGDDGNIIKHNFIPSENQQKEMDTWYYRTGDNGSSSQWSTEKPPTDFNYTKNGNWADNFSYIKGGNLRIPQLNEVRLRQMGINPSQLSFQLLNLDGTDDYYDDPQKARIYGTLYGVYYKGEFKGNLGLRQMLGPGISDEIDISKAKSIGLRLIRSLTRQLQGKMNYKYNNGAEFNISLLQSDKRE